MIRLLENPTFARKFTIGVLVVVMALAIGCERKPEDLEKWRNAQNGMSQLAEWVQSDSEPMEVRKRAVQIMLEEGASNDVPRALDNIDDESTRQQIADAAVPTIEEMWAEQDFPELTEEQRQEGGQVAPDGLQAIRAVDAIYRLDPYFGDETRESTREIIREWISADWEVRTQWAETSLPLLVPLAGDGGAELVSDWIARAHNPQEVASSLRRRIDEDQHGPIDAAVAERAQQEHPDLSREMMHAVDGATTEEIIPYLEMAIFDEQTPPEFRQAGMDTLATVGTERAVEVLVRMVEEHQAPFRWAAANAIIDAKGAAGVIDIADALPDDTDAYSVPEGDEMTRYIGQICNYVNTNIEDGNTEVDTEAFRQLLQSDRWPAQVLGVQCVDRMDVAELREDVENLSGESTSIPAWEERATIGQFATAVAETLDE